jgi:hypothetical protein
LCYWYKLKSLICHQEIMTPVYTIGNSKFHRSNRCAWVQNNVRLQDGIKGTSEFHIQLRLCLVIWDLFRVGNDRYNMKLMIGTIRYWDLFRAGN